MLIHGASHQVITELEAHLTALFDDAGVLGSLHAAVIGHPELPVVSVAGDLPMPAASLYKLPTMVAFCQCADHGHIDPQQQTLLTTQHRAHGPTGTAICQDPVSMSWRDLVRMMITISDNAAGDAVLERIGVSTVQTTAEELGMVATCIRGGTTHTERLLLEDLPAPDTATAMTQLMDPNTEPATRTLDPLLVSAITAHDACLVLTRIWENAAASPQQCQFMREVLAQQAWGHRFAQAFAYPGVGIAAKTGSFGPLRHEAGVITHPEEPPIVVGVLTRSARRDKRVPAAEHIVGQAALAAVQFLRQYL